MNKLMNIYFHRSHKLKSKIWLNIFVLNIPFILYYISYHLDSKVSLKNPYHTRFSVLYRIFPYCLVNIHPQAGKDDVRGRVAMREGPMIN